MSTADAPMMVSGVALTVRDLQRVGDFYQSVIGLNEIRRDGESRLLGQGDLALLELRADPFARSLPREAGLYHTAFLLPARNDLGRWLAHAAGQGLRLDGAADHLVSEALYLHDPEGNGIEIYTDRPRSAWTYDGDMVRMSNRAMDLPELARAPGLWQGAPEGTVIGHVHLQVGDIAGAEAFYNRVLGFDIAARAPGASFYGSGGYHHHLATNIWQSRGAGPRSRDAAGLAELTLSVDPAMMAGQAADLTDPWGNRITLAPRAA
ncbi:MAG: VOC family protein [Paracoccus sp. (in: a-proteobacteria)]|nr:VOC family protein [Paracoccus sp. (in: a-proteobacteria)]